MWLVKVGYYDSSHKLGLQVASSTQGELKETTLAAKHCQKLCTPIVPISLIAIRLACIHIS